ncbi:MAG: Trk system potassium transporter TrkA [Planctomycetota bacterium]
MNIVILGAGRVGTSFAELLCQQEHSVTVLDIDANKVKQINEELDLRAFVGSASQSTALFQAGVSSADICMAMTGQDEVNIVAASMAKAMGARRAIARVFAPVFRDLSSFDYQKHFSIDRMLSLEQLTAMELARGIREPGSVVMEQFARGGLEVQEFVVAQPCKVTEKTIRNLGLPAGVRIGTIERDGKMWIVGADDQIQIGDKVTLFCGPEEIKPMKMLFKTSIAGTQRVVIAGGGETGLHLARTLEREDFKVMIIEANEQRCEKLAHLLDSTTIIHADACDLASIEEQRVGSAHVFVACTPDDEDNMMLCVRADNLGTNRVMAIIERDDYGSVIERLGIDVAVSTRDVMARQLLAFLNHGFVISRAKFPCGKIGIFELDVLEDAPVTQNRLEEVGLPDRCLIAAVIEDDHVKIPGGRDRLKPGDTAILLVEDDVEVAALAAFTPAN